MDLVESWKRHTERLRVGKDAVTDGNVDNDLSLETG